MQQEKVVLWMMVFDNNSSKRRKIVTYLIIEKPRLGAEEYNRIIQQARNKLQTYPGGILYYRGEEKLRIFYYTKQT